MLVKQLSVFVENKLGRLKQMTDVLAKNDINLVTLQIADTKEFGILRAITRDNARAVQVLREAGFTVSITELIGVEVEDSPGALSDLLGLFDESGISIEYLYSFKRNNEKRAIILLRVDDTEGAVAMLKASGVAMLAESVEL